MFDLKPDAPEGIRSPFRPIDTVAPGIRLSDQLPLLARQTDKIAVVRSLTHGSNSHEPSVYPMLTGRTNPALSFPGNVRKRTDFPNFGSVLSYFVPPTGLSASATVPRPVAHGGVTYAGFLGPRFDPLEVLPPHMSTQPPTHPTDLLPDLPETRLVARTGLLKQLERQDWALQKAQAGRDLDGFRDKAMRMIATPAVRGAFDLNQEAPALRDRYGRNEYGENFLLARRVVEAGVRAVSVVWMYLTPREMVVNVWDNHSGIPGLGGIAGYAMLKEKYCLPPLSRSVLGAGQGREGSLPPAVQGPQKPVIDSGLSLALRLGSRWAAFPCGGPPTPLASPNKGLTRGKRVPPSLYAAQPGSGRLRSYQGAKALIALKLGTFVDLTGVAVPGVMVGRLPPQCCLPDTPGRCRLALWLQRHCQNVGGRGILLAAFDGLVEAGDGFLPLPEPARRCSCSPRR